MSQRRCRTTKPTLAVYKDGVVPLGNNYNGIPFALNLATGAVEPTAPAGADGAALRSRMFSCGEVTAAKLVEILCNGGYRAWQDHGTAVVWTPIGRVIVVINTTQELLQFMSFRPFREEVSEEDRRALATQFNTSGLVGRYSLEVDCLTVEYELAISCGITGPQVLLATRNLVQNVEATINENQAANLLE